MLAVCSGTYETRRAAHHIATVSRARATHSKHRAIVTTLAQQASCHVAKSLARKELA